MNLTDLEAKTKIQELTLEIETHNHRYYVLNAPTISDEEFDNLMRSLQNLEQQFPQYLSPTSPTMRIGGEINKNFPSVTHRYPMLSLANTYSTEEVQDFIDRTQKLTEGKPMTFVCELKYDGIAIGLTYKNGILTQAVTRGNGLQGDDITDNIKTIRSIPLQLRNEDYPAEFEIRGEVILPHKSFETINNDRLEKGEEPFANPRNAAGGSLKLQNPSEVAKRQLDCFLYFLLGKNLPVHTHFERMQYAKKMGFKVPQYTSVCKDATEIMDFISHWDAARKTLPFDIDGIVIKVNETGLWESLGNTAKNPRWAIAYKFKAERVETKLTEVVFQVGRTGVITPVAQLQPVALGGTIVKRASLHNADIIEKLDVCIGDTVFVEKGGEIIPKIVGIKLEDRTGQQTPFEYITHCPECGTKLQKKEGEAHHYCPNEYECPPQIVGKLIHFTGKKAMDINSLGEERVEMLWQNGLLNNIADFYTLTREKLLGISSTSGEKKISLQEKGVQNILSALKESQKVPFERVLYALGIRYVGEVGAKSLAKHFQNINNLMHADRDALLNVEDIGEKIADSVSDYFQQPKNIAIIERLRLAGLQFEWQHRNISNLLQSKTFVISGIFENYSREALKADIEQHGGKVISSISPKLSYLLIGTKPGAEKIKKAEQSGVTILSEQEYTDLTK